MIFSDSGLTIITHNYHPLANLSEEEAVGYTQPPFSDSVFVSFELRMTLESN